MGVHLGHATLVVNHWHVIRLANQCVEEVRRRVQPETRLNAMKWGSAVTEVPPE